jgi:hypothetical protein
MKGFLCLIPIGRPVNLLNRHAKFKCGTVLALGVMGTLFLGTVTFLGTATGVSAQEITPGKPLSAINWLTQSLDAPRNISPQAMPNAHSTALRNDIAQLMGQGWMLWACSAAPKLGYRVIYGARPRRLI